MYSAILTQPCLALDMTHPLHLDSQPHFFAALGPASQTQPCSSRLGQYVVEWSLSVIQYSVQGGQDSSFPLDCLGAGVSASLPRLCSAHRGISQL